MSKNLISRLRYLFAKKGNFFGHKHFTRFATGCSILDPGCWIAAVFYLFFIQLKCVEINGYYLNKLWNIVACGSRLPASSIQNPASRMYNYHAIRCRIRARHDSLMINDEIWISMFGKNKPSEKGVMQKLLEEWFYRISLILLV